MNDFVGIKPIGYDRDGPMYSSRDVTLVTSTLINANTNYFTKRAIRMNKDIESASASTDQAIHGLQTKLDKFFSLEEKMEATAKSASGKIKDSANKLSTGLSKIEKLANFDRLERYVELLERAEKAMSSLADLEKTGKLEKIAAAIR